MIASNDVCDHIDGNMASYCASSNVESDEIAKSHCTDLPSCVGYEYDALRNILFLFVSDKTCPAGFKYSKQANDAKTMDDLVPASLGSKDTNCYGKNEGKSLSLSLFKR